MLVAFCLCTPLGCVTAGRQAANEEQAIVLDRYDKHHERVPRASGEEHAILLYRYDKVVLRDTYWGKIAAFQQALSKELESRGKGRLQADGKFGNQTRKAITKLLKCPGFEAMAADPADARSQLNGAVHSALWNRLLPGVPLPTVHERAMVALLTYEGTDYDQIEWNYNTDDDKSAMTWGPCGATVGFGHEVHAILTKLYTNQRSLLEQAFADEGPTLAAFLEADLRIPTMTPM